VCRVGRSDGKAPASVSSVRAVGFDRQPTIAGEFVALRPLDQHDFAALHAAGRDPLVWAQHPQRDRWCKDAFRSFFAEHLASGGALAVLDRGSSEVIGVSRFDYLDVEASEVEIGWTFLARRYWGGRYNGELKRLMLEHAFRSFRTVVFVVGEQNFRSRRAVEKLGASRAGARRGQLLYRLTESAYLLSRPSG
jgi:N-acetyltransferase